MSEVDENEEVHKGVTLLPFKIRSNQLNPDLTHKVMAVVTEACDKHTLQKDLAEYIKRAVDEIPDLNVVGGKGPWQCIIGKSFASAITHETSFSIFFDIPIQGQTVLLFKSIGVQAA